MNLRKEKLGSRREPESSLDGRVSIDLGVEEEKKIVEHCHGSPDSNS